MQRVLVTGASGALGSLIVDRLIARDIPTLAMVRDDSGFEFPAAAEVVVGDVTRRGDVDAAVRAADVVVHTATDPMRHRRVDFEGSQNVAYACVEREAHLVYPSIVGCEQSPLPYHRTKARVEALLGRIPGLSWTIQRTTQFHWLVDSLLARRVLPLPEMATLQPVDEAEVAGRLVGLVLAGASGRVRDFGGPEVASLQVLAEKRRQARGTAAKLLRGTGVGPLRGLAEGRLITVDGERGLATFDDWLRTHREDSRR